MESRTNRFNARCAHAGQAASGGPAGAALIALFLVTALVVNGCNGNPERGSAVENDAGVHADASTVATAPEQGEMGFGSSRSNGDDSSEAPRSDSGESPSQAGVVGEEGGTNASGTPARALGDYLSCERDSDCPVGFGDCVQQIPLNLADAAGTTTVPANEVFSAIEGSGICTRVCTNDPSVCSELNARDARGDRVPYTCQLVIAGDSPYAVGDYPFAVDELAMTAGVAFGAVCRPPFELHADVADSLCKQCSASSECGEGVCYELNSRASGTAADRGVCLMPCEGAEQCPGGFSCESLSDGGEELGLFCAPLLDTCGACLDRDGDGYGIGQCGNQDTLSTAVDCDDTNPAAYFDADDAAHAFSDSCGEQDYNCNGLSDAAEQLAEPRVYGEVHCGACGTPCAGPVENGSAECLETDRGGSCGARCDSGWADCTDQPGCETPVDDASRLYFPDRDGDGFGDASAPSQFACGGQVPEGAVPDASDCDDDNADVHPDAAELCDGLDNDCNGEIDDGLADDGQIWYADADGDGFGDASAMTVACQQLPGYVENADDCADDDAQINPLASDDDCDGVDDDCDEDADDDYLTAIECDGDNPASFFMCVAGELVCECVARSEFDVPGDGVDSNCDGFDADVGAVVFAAPGDDPECTGDRGSTPDNPCRQLQAAIDRAASEGKSVVASVGTYVSPVTLELRDGVSVYGGFDFTTGRHAAGGETLLQRVGAGHRVVVVGTEIQAATMLANIVLEALSPEAPGLGTYGLVCDGCTGLTVRDVLITLEAATDGAVGDPGTNGRVGSAGRNRSGNNAGGAGGQNFARGGNGGSADECWSDPHTDGSGPRAGKSSGQVGGSGDGATSPGVGGSDFVWMPLQANTQLWTSGDGRSGSTGLPGSGGAGGDGYHYAKYVIFYVGCDWGGGGGGGGGGEQGGGGGGGGGGGSSIGMQLRDSVGLVLEATEIRVGSPGNGGAGGVGGDGGNGGARGLGGGGGSHGGAGGKGGGGSGGGGGVGGSAINLLLDPVTRASLDLTGVRQGTVPQTGGSAGAGGLGGNVTTGLGGVDGLAGVDGIACDVAEVESTGGGACVETSDSGAFEGDLQLTAGRALEVQ